MELPRMLGRIQNWKGDANLVLTSGFPWSSYNTVSAFPFRCFFGFCSKLPPIRGRRATHTSQEGLSLRGAAPK